ncbi:MAG: ATP-grasp domain-containing protein, partial [Acidimicrobiales bacterium]
MSNESQPTAKKRIGVVGAGQLARMMGEASRAASVSVSVLAESLNDCATTTCQSVILGSATNYADLARLASTVDVVTFDHELVDLAALHQLEADGVVVRPSSTALRYAVDKAFQRESFRDAGIPVPAFLAVSSPHDEQLNQFLDQLATPPVVKAARGGYDGRGVAFPASRSETLEIIGAMSKRGDVLVEERLNLNGEVAHLVARGVDDSLVTYPVVTSVQRDAMCVEVRYPSQLDDATTKEANRLSRRIASLVRGVGVMAIEYFVTAQGLLVNEIALRPHNTGHWTIEGTSTSQFTQHLLAVSAQPLLE